MTFWLVAVPVAVVVFALVWWTSGRAGPDRRRRGIQSEADRAKGNVTPYDTRSDTRLGGF